MIFICDEKEEAKKYGDYATDVNYARKLFLTEDEYIEYFCYYDILLREADAIKHSLDKEILQKIEK